MATPPTELAPPSTLVHKAAQSSVVAGVGAAVSHVVTSLFDPASPTDSLTKISTALHTYVAAHGKASGQLALANYKRSRAAANISDRLPILHPVSPPPLAQVAANLDRITADMLASIDTHQFVTDHQASIEASIQRLILDTGRQSTIGFIKKDKGALGFVRVAHPGACAFCVMCAIRRDANTNRPGVYKTRETAGQVLSPNTVASVNRFHDGCQCTVEAVFSNDYQLSPALADLERLYFTSTVNSKSGESLNDFRRALAAERAGKPIPELPVPRVITPKQSPADALVALLDRLKPAA